MDAARTAKRLGAAPPPRCSTARVLAPLVADVSGWMERKGYTSVTQMRGAMSQQSIPDSNAFVRGN
jgi:hypothetical protein